MTDLEFTPTTVPTRKRNPRRVLMEMLKIPRSRITWIHQTFSGVTTHVYDIEVRDEHRNALRRKRREDEYPENDPRVWSKIYSQTRCAIEELTEIMEYAKQQHGVMYARDNAQKLPTHLTEESR